METKSITDYASDGHYDKLREILDSDTSGRLPINAALYAAAQVGNLSCVNLLVENGAEVDVVSGKDHKHGRTPLLAAVMYNHLDVVKYLVTKTKDIDRCDNHGQSPVHIAVRSGFLSILQELLAHGAKKFDEDRTSGYHPLFLAARYAGDLVCKQLIDWGCDARMMDCHSCNILHHAGMISVTKLALGLGIPVDQKCKRGKTALMLAVKSGREKTVNFLLSSKADPFLVDDKGESAMFMAAESNNAGFVSKFLDVAVSKDQLNTVTVEGKTCLSAACHMNCINNGDVVRRLLVAGASCKGHTAVHNRLQDKCLLTVALNSKECESVMNLFLTYGDYRHEEISEWHNKHAAEQTSQYDNLVTKHRIPPKADEREKALRLVEHELRQIKSLKHSTRLTIRHAMKTPLTLNYVDRLPFPKRMKEYILFLI